MPVSGSNSASTWRVLVLAGDLAHPTVCVVTDDEDGQLGDVSAGLGEHGQLRSRLGGNERTQTAAHARPAARPRLGHLLAPERERQSRIGRDLDRRPRRDSCRIEEQRDGPLLARVNADRRLLEAHRRVEREGGRSRSRAAAAEPTAAPVPRPGRCVSRRRLGRSRPVRVRRRRRAAHRSTRATQPRRGP